MKILVQSGVTDCACCGMQVMTDNINEQAFCDVCGDENCDKTNPAAWHCPTGECDGTMCDENGNHEDVKAKAVKIGADHGKAAASSVFDGNTSNETYRRYLQGIEAGDPEIMDALPQHGLSGEWADGFSARDLELELGINPADEGDDFGTVCDAYEEAFDTAVQDEITRVAKYHVGDETVNA